LRRRPRFAALAKDSSKTTNDVGPLRRPVMTLADVEHVDVPQRVASNGEHVRELATAIEPDSQSAPITRAASSVIPRDNRQRVHGEARIASQRRIL
jgi:hypothetical protein